MEGGGAAIWVKGRKQGKCKRFGGVMDILLVLGNTGYRVN